MNIIHNKQIAIVGGGPGGLTLARLLQMKQAAVTVYERDAHRGARTQGATLDLHEESGLLALEEAGLSGAFKTHYRPGADKMRIVDSQGRILQDDHLGEDNDRSRPEIDRGPLQNILLDSLRPGTVTWDSHLVGLSRQKGCWQLEFSNGHTATADIVIAADGANSRIRPLLTPIRPFYSGITIVEGIVHDAARKTPHVSALLKGGKIFALGDSRSLILSSKGDGSIVFYTGCATEEHWSKNCGIDFSDKTSVLNWFRKEYHNWGPVWMELFEQADAPFVPRPQYCMPFDQAWEAQPDLTILGDAAHLMPPYAGEGVNMAMLDALELSQCLTSDRYADTVSAIAAYEQQMRTRAAATARITMESTKALHSPEALAFLMNVIGAAEHD